MPPIIPIKGMINSKIDFLIKSTFTWIGDISYLKKIQQTDYQLLLHEHGGLPMKEFLDAHLLGQVFRYAIY